jgi:hypothetical protein
VGCFCLQPRGSPSEPHVHGVQVYKAFHSWRSSVRQKLFAQVRARLTRRLFLAKPTFCPSLMELAAYVDELRDVQMLVTGQVGPPFNALPSLCLSRSSRRRCRWSAIQVVRSRRGSHHVRMRVV